MQVVIGQIGASLMNFSNQINGKLKAALMASDRRR